MAHHGICTVPDCGNSLIVAHGLCENHYRRWRRNGSPTAGRTPPGEPLRYFREVVMVYEGDECLIWPYNRTPLGYGTVLFDGQVRVVSRMVCEEANGPPPTPEHQGAHECGQGRAGCVTKRHMSWKTVAENAADRIGHGTHNRGERGTAKLTEANVREIRARIGSGETQRSIAKDFNVSFKTISKIHVGDTWAWME